MHTGSVETYHENLLGLHAIKPSVQVFLDDNHSFILEHRNPHCAESRALCLDFLSEDVLQKTLKLKPCAEHGRQVGSGGTFSDMKTGTQKYIDSHEEKRSLVPETWCHNMIAIKKIPRAKVHETPNTEANIMH